VTNYTVPSSDSQYINILAPGPDGNVWYGSNGIIGKMCRTVKRRSTTWPRTWTRWPPTRRQHVVRHKRYGTGRGDIARGNVQTALPTIRGAELALRPTEFHGRGTDGNMWFSDANGYIGGRRPVATFRSGWSDRCRDGRRIIGARRNLFAATANCMPPTPSLRDQIAIAGGAPTGVAQIVNPAACNVYGLTIGPDGNVWFSDNCSNIGTIPLANSRPARSSSGRSPADHNELIGSLASSQARLGSGLQ